MNYKQLAEHFNVSAATISLIVNHKPGVSEETRARILAGLEEMGISDLVKKEKDLQNLPETGASSIKSLLFVVFKRDGAILDMHPFFLLIVEIIEARARQYGYNILFSTVDLRSPIDEQINYLNTLNASGAIIFATEMTEDDTDLFRGYTNPFVFLDNNFSHLPVNTVAINNEMGTWQAIEHLLEMGHRRIGYLSCRSRISSFLEREIGYRNALAEYGMELSKEYIYRLDFTEEGSYRDFSAILKEKPSLPTAFVSDDDTIALGVMRALKEYGYSVPGDISIIGYDDRPSCEIASTPLTTVNVSKNSFAATAVDNLIRIIENQKDSESAAYRTIKVRVETFLSVRESVGRNE